MLLVIVLEGRPPRGVMADTVMYGSAAGAQVRRVTAMGTVRGSVHLLKSRSASTSGKRVGGCLSQ